LTLDQIILGAVILGAIGLFLWGRWRHDTVALAALIACVVAGLVPAETAFEGFGHPAVITVACVLILSSALQTTGAVDAMTRAVLPSKAGPFVTLTALTALAAFLSAFMNNVGALALLMPVALQIAARQNIPPGKALMPLAFGSILGGMTTLIGTPPNLLVSSFRAQTEAAGGQGFAMFDFAPVGGAVAVIGLLFILVVGWRLVPERKRASVEGFETSAYLTEARVGEKSKAAGMTLREADRVLEETDAQIVGLVRDEVRIPAPSPYRKVRAGDVLVIESDPEGLNAALSNLGLQLEEEVSTKPDEEDEGKEKREAEEAEAAKAPEDAPETEALAGPKPDAAAAHEIGPTGDEPKDRKTRDKAKSEEDRRKVIHSEDVLLVEMAVAPGSAFAGRSATDISLRSRFSINLLAVSRAGNRSRARLRTMKVQEGDVLLLQGSPEQLSDFAARMGCVPLAERSLRIPSPGKAWMAGGAMALGIAGAAFGLLPAAVAFAAGVLAIMLLKVVPLRTIYDAVDWPVIVLLGALIPVAGAMSTTGAADLIATVMLDYVAQGNAVFAVALILIVTMTLSDFMNNAATAAVMCPIAIGAATQLGASPDPFLMAVAVGASCAFLTPIGHQNNTLILGPGGFRFSDYWPLGLPLEVIVVAVGAPMILIVWPL
jgi:di/tricarboxylate transporter